MTRELRSVTDNPVIFAEDGDVLSGGNFHGEPIAMALDYLKIGVSEIANISDRRSFKLLNPADNEGLPAFLTESPGLESGLMIAQYVGASLVSDNKVYAHPASVDSVPTSANKEDHVAMGVQAGTQLIRILDNTERVLAIEFALAAQGHDLREKLSKRTGSTRLRALKTKVREVFPYVDSDRSVSHELELIRTAVVAAGIPSTLLHLDP